MCLRRCVSEGVSQNGVSECDVTIFIDNDKAIRIKVTNIHVELQIIN